MTDSSDNHERFIPDPKFDDPAILSKALIRRVLPLVSAPGRYIGGELGAIREGYSQEKANILLAFPDAYEVGMSHQGIRALYSLLKKHPDTFCDLAYTPWPDMQHVMRSEQLPLFAIESRRPVGQFDVVGFSLGYELAYSNMLAMIDLAGSPVLAADRSEGDPIFIAGGSCTLNPAVIGPFLDVIFPGDGEDVVLAITNLVASWKSDGGTRATLVDKLRSLPGAWYPGINTVVKTNVLQDLNAYELPDQLVPVIEPVHDRLSLEVMRGCARGCRFCQAGMITRPVRERDAQGLIDAAKKGVAESGYSEVSLLSLSTSDYSALSCAVAGIQDSMEGLRTNLVLPSLRLDSMDKDLYKRISNERPANFTFAPEAGSQRLRNVINKNITEEDIVRTAGEAFDSGVKGIKLYFMIGLPTETNDDLDELVALVGRLVPLAPRGGGQINVSVSPFAPKAHTPFQWSGQISRSEIERRNNYLSKRLRRLNVKVSLREPNISFLEAVLGLGDEKLSEVVLRVWQLGGCFDAWSEYFDFSRWETAFSDAGINPEDYTTERDTGIPLPWDTVLAGIDKEFLQQDLERALKTETLEDCRLEGTCVACGACIGELKHICAVKLESPAKTSAKIADTAVSADGSDKQTDESQDSQSVVSGTSAANDFDPRNADPEKPGTEADKWRKWRQQAAAKCWYRVEFEKTGGMIFLGHLDFQRQLQLALRRSSLPVAYSRGYHPHPLMKFGPPLSVGVIGLRETMDIALEYQVPGWHRQLNACLPNGLRILRSVVVGAQTPVSIDQCAQRFDFSVELPAPSNDGPATESVAAAIDAFTASENWPCVRRRAKGDVEIDARPLVPAGGLGMLNEATGDSGCILQFSLLRGKNGGVLPVNDFLTGLLGEALPEPRYSVIKRLGYYGQQSNGNWLSPIEEVGESSQRFWLSRQLND